MNWETSQDHQITESLDVLGAVTNHPSAVRRIWALADELILQKHFLTIAAEFKRDDHFTLIDVGCGHGALLYRVAGHFQNARLFGNDTNAPSLAAARRLVPAATFGQHSFAAISGRYDAAVCCEVFEHVEDYEGLIDTLFRVVKPGGLISFSTPSGWMYRTPRPGNLYHALRHWEFFSAVRLHPERHWLRALPYHPGILPARAIDLFTRRGGTILSRRSALWFMEERSIAYRICDRLGGFAGATKLDAWVRFLDALMEIVPGLRIFEKRFILAVRTP
ncbi:MAG TPA: class I SAM-dependent methyltransferase [Stellaceae bacterium]|nr:class I SAM-dependent methyltransferase [Stellaceae bacterium]